VFSVFGELSGSGYATVLEGDSTFSFFESGTFTYTTL
jgi:hypothetical protein